MSDLFRLTDEQMERLLPFFLKSPLASERRRWTSGASLPIIIDTPLAHLHPTTASRWSIATSPRRATKRIVEYNEDDCRAIFVLLDGIRTLT